MWTGELEDRDLGMTAPEKVAVVVNLGTAKGSVFPKYLKVSFARPVSS